MDPINIQATIGQTIEWYKYEVMRDLINVKEAWETYFKNDLLGVPVDLSTIQARTQSLFNSLYGYLNRKLDPKVFQNYRSRLFDGPILDPKYLREIFWIIQIQLDKDSFTKIDNRKSYDSTRAEKENENYYL